LTLITEIQSIMTIKENILKDIDSIVNPMLLNQIFDYLQILKQSDSLKISNKELLEQHAGSLSDKEATTISNVIDREFNNIEGEW